MRDVRHFLKETHFYVRESKKVEGRHLITTHTTTKLLSYLQVGIKFILQYEVIFRVKQETIDNYQ